MTAPRGFSEESTFVPGAVTEPPARSRPGRRRPGIVGPYSRISRDSISDDQLQRLVEIVTLTESGIHAAEHRYFGKRDAPEVVSEHRADLDAIRELHALLLHERQERVVDDHERTTE